MENPWNIHSTYELQYFNCPSCIFKSYSKQEIVNHACEFHPESLTFLENITDNSLADVICPWNGDNVNIKTEIEDIDQIGDPDEYSEYLVDEESYIPCEVNVTELDGLKDVKRAIRLKIHAFGILSVMEI